MILAPQQSLSFMQDSNLFFNELTDAVGFRATIEKNFVAYRRSHRRRHRARECVESPILKAPLDKPSS